MKHPSTHRILADWNHRRGHARVPELSDVEPNILRELLSDGFVLSRAAARYSFRLAGTQICARLGRDLTNQELATLFDPDSCHEAEAVVAFVEEEATPAVAGVSARGSGGTLVRLELLLLPFGSRAQASISVAGALAPFATNADRLGKLTLNSWRYVHPPLQARTKRAVLKYSIANGLVMYGGGTPSR